MLLGHIVEVAGVIDNGGIPGIVLDQSKNIICIDIAQFGGFPLGNHHRNGVLQERVAVRSLGFLNDIFIVLQTLDDNLTLGIRSFHRNKAGSLRFLIHMIRHIVNSGGFIQHGLYIIAVGLIPQKELHLGEVALAYNAAITPGTVEEAYSQEAIQTASENYVNQLDLSGTGIMGYVEIPTIGVDLPIYHGTGNDSLDRGTGHLLGSSLPVGGESTHTIITGHSGMASQKMFTDLEQLQEGDVFYLHVLDEVLAYQVDTIHTVLPHDTTYLGIMQGKDLCTLVTCTPTGVNTHRLLVRGTRISYEPSIEVQSAEPEHEVVTSSHWEDQYWFGIRLGVMAMVSIVLLVNAVLFIRKKRSKPPRRKGGRYVRK